MSRILIALGSANHKPDSELSVVYVGRDGSALDRALAASPYAAHLLIKNPVSIRKHNGAAAANLAKLVEAERSMEKDEYKVTKAEMDGYLGELKRLQDLANQRGTDLAAAKERIAQLEAAVVPAVPETSTAPAEVQRNSPEQGELSPAPQTDTPPPVGEAPKPRGGRRG